MNTVQLQLIIGHFLIVIVYVLPPVLFTVVGMMESHNDPFFLWLIVAGVYVAGHLISSGVIR